MPPGKLSESEFLAQQAEAAKRAMAGALEDLKARLGQGADPRAWVHDHPWATLAAAAVAGFAAAATVVPSKEQQALKKLAAIERALHTPPPHVEVKAADGEHAGHADAQGSGLWSTILRELFSFFKPVLASVIGGLVQAEAGGTAGPPPAAGYADDEATDTETAGKSY